MNKHKIIILPANIEILAEENESLKNALTENGVEFEFPCGGIGVCKRCIVRIIKSNGLEVKSLACQLKIDEDLVVEIPNREQKHEILTEGIERQVILDPLVKKVYIDLPPPSLEDNRDDWNRVVGKRGVNANLKLLRELPEKLRKNNFKATLVIASGRVIAVESEDTSEKLLGMAFDIGTTTIVGYLIDLKTGREIARVSSLNPQTKYGADVISRIIYAFQSAEGLEKLHKEVVNELNNIIEKAVNKTGYKPEDVYAITVAGNTTMLHLFLKIQPGYLAQAPYVPVITDPVIVDADDINIKINPAGKVYTFPNVAGFVGGDTVAAALASEMDKANELKLLIDIGTNGEIVLGTKGRLLACSTAAGPAFEGVQISCGMRGASGAIDHVYMGEEYKYTVIGGVLPRGIAGSGLTDAVAELLKTGILDKNGRILKPEEIKSEPGKKYRDRIVRINGILSFVIAQNTATGKPIYISQKDVREFQLAKGAIAAGIEVLLKTYGAKVEDIDEVFLAGAFGNYLNPASACKVGLIPQELEGKMRGIGNAAGAGSKLAMLSEKEYERAIILSQKIHYIELSSHPDFKDIFFSKLGFL
ncbi:ASKHA domain-containing protein [Thermoanaerobacterium sp. DL9XJH110]|uniref:ASKHA domain-containing protein n=1 Tax=Thermoanaerobacterium sp. DL9XJH110 TaxID=3386643 RepID=UPI003BB71426